MWTWLCSICLWDKYQLDSKPKHFYVFTTFFCCGFLLGFFFFCILKKRSIHLVLLLQVAEAKPLVIPADAMQREFESCWRREHTAANLPLLLHQVGLPLAAKSQELSSGPAGCTVHIWKNKNSLLKTGTKMLVLAVSLYDVKISSSVSLKGRNLSQVRWAWDKVFPVSWCFCAVPVCLCCGLFLFSFLKWCSNF